MPKVTLLGAPGGTYHLHHGKGRFDFRVGEPVQDVPVSIALYLQKMVTPQDTPLFLIEDLPEIVEASTSETRTEDVPTEQNVDSGPRQTRFPSWPSE